MKGGKMGKMNTHEVKAIKKMYPMQQGDVPKTFADISSLTKNFNYQPKTSIKSGVSKFVAWYKEFNNK